MGTEPVTTWEPGLASRSAPHAGVDSELQAIFARAPLAVGHGPDAAGTLGTGGSGHGGRWKWYGFVAGTALAAVAVVSLTLPWNPRPEVAARATAPAADSPGLVPDPLPVRPLAAVSPPVLRRTLADPAPRPAAKRAASTENRRASALACAGYRGDALARCLWPVVMSADRDLRRAYDRAVRNGAPRSMLVAYNDRWSDLRRDARRDPRAVIAGYRRMADDLDRARADG